MVVNSRVDQKKVLLKFCKGKGKVAETALVDSPPSETKDEENQHSN